MGCKKKGEREGRGEKEKGGAEKGDLAPKVIYKSGRLWHQVSRTA